MVQLLKENTHNIRIKLAEIITFKNETLFSDWPVRQRVNWYSSLRIIIT